MTYYDQLDASLGVTLLSRLTLGKFVVHCHRDFPSYGCGSVNSAKMVRMRDSISGTVKILFGEP